MMSKVNQSQTVKGNEKNASKHEGSTAGVPGFAAYVCPQNSCTAYLWSSRLPRARAQGFTYVVSVDCLLSGRGDRTVMGLRGAGPREMVASRCSRARGHHVTWERNILKEHTAVVSLSSLPFHLLKKIMIHIREVCFRYLEVLHIKSILISW